jgi:hypothetical protein
VCPITAVKTNAFKKSNRMGVHMGRRMGCE